MDLQEIKKVEVGDFVRYVGPKRNRARLKTNELYEIGYVRPDGEEFTLKDGVRVGYSPFAKEWDVSSFERVETPIQLKAVDYKDMIDFALDTKDFAWFKELHNEAFPTGEISEY